MKLAIIGRPQSGKTTIFNAATGHQETVGDFSKAVHRASVKIPDARLDRLAELVNPKKITTATIEYFDAPGLSGDGKNAGKLEISDDLRQSEAFLMVVDAYNDGTDPKSDIQTLIDEMVLLDHVLIDGVINKRERKMKVTGDKTALQGLDLLKKVLGILENEQPLLDVDFTPEEEKELRGFQFLSQKPLLVVLNISEEALADKEKIYNEHASIVAPGKRELAVICGKIQADLIGLDEEDQQMFMDDLGIKEKATDKLIQQSYALLGLISYLTAGEPEVRAWTIKKGTTAVKAAGVIHSDIERGFIRAEVVAFDDYDKLETPAAMKAAGKSRLEGKEYVVADGDVILFRFNV